MDEGKAKYCPLCSVPRWLVWSNLAKTLFGEIKLLHQYNISDLIYVYTYIYVGFMFLALVKDL